MNLLELAKKMYWADENIDGKNDKYDYGWGGNGRTDFEKNAPDGTPGKGELDIDCSHLVNNVLKEFTGYNIPYETTSSMRNSRLYDEVTSDIRPGDIVLFNGHVGIVESYDPSTGKGKFFGSQTSTGPAITAFGPGAYWSKPTKFLRLKTEWMSVLFLDTALDSIKDKIRSLFTTATTTRSPILLDLDGDGIINTLGTDAGIHFDHDGNGFKELSGWVAPGDGVLMLDRDLDDILDNGSELFGNFTPLANGMLAINGFQALAQFDTNEDGKIDANDPIWSQLKVWQHDPEATDAGDPDSSGIFTTLDELGVQSINTGYTNTNLTDANGNTIKQAGSFTRTDGSEGNASDVYFQVDNMYTIANEWLDVPEDIAALPDLQGYGNVYDLQQAMVRDESGTLKGLVEQFMNETDSDARHSLITQILYKWTGVENVDPLSRAATKIYGNATKNYARPHMSLWTGDIYKEMWFNTAKGNNIPKLAA